MASELTVLSGLHRTIEELPLVDQHAHGVTGRDLSRAAFEELITEAHGLAPDWMTPFDSQLGHAILRHCAPVLGLDAFISPEEYLARRARLGVVAVNRLLLGAAGAGHYLIETGYRADEVVGPSGMAELAAVPVDEVVRLEAVAEQVAASGVSAAGFARPVRRGAGGADPHRPRAEEHRRLPARARPRPGPALARRGDRGRGPLARRRRPPGGPGAAAAPHLDRAGDRPAAAVPHRDRRPRPGPAPRRPAARCAG
ncbi:hypothetical protein ACFSTC_30965 [Nonomuraea ferruginea]